MNSPKDELTALLALQRIEGLGIARTRYLYEKFGNAQEIFRNRKDIAKILTGVVPNIADAMGDSSLFSKVEQEVRFIEENSIRYLIIGDEDYPARLRECSDAPLLLFFKGNANLNSERTVSIVGTRKVSEYGRRLCSRFVEELKELVPDVLIISGLAYGVDIASHQASLDCGLDTVGVVAHGLDMLYPARHREIAKQMTQQGGILTEFPSGTNPLPANFLRRNRIIAGMADAVVVVESAARGGSLATADMAQSYHRDCFAFPGSVGNIYSEGCNNLIRDNKAALITSASDMVQAMRWGVKSVHPSSGSQMVLPMELSPKERMVYEKIATKSEGIHINTLIVECNIAYPEMVAILFELELKGLTKPSPGSIYRPLL